MSAPATTMAARSASRGIAIFGRHTRYMLGRYLIHVALVTSVLLAIALTIDLWPQFETIAKSGGGGPLAAVWSVARFSVLRTPWLIAPFLPFAAFLGVFWTELMHTTSGERMLIWNSGRSPLLCLAPVVLLGLILGAGEFLMDAYLGPASMAVQMHERLGLDGERLDRTQTGDASWIALPDGLLKAEIEYGPPPVLHNVLLFRRSTAGKLTKVETASIARRIPNTNKWVMANGYSWHSGMVPTPSQDTQFFLESSNDALVPFATRTVSLDIDPLWLSYFGMEPQYIPLSVLRQLANANWETEWRSRYRTRLSVLYGETVLPGAMALLAACLSMVFLAYHTGFRALVGIAFAGYMAHFGTKACLLLGQTGYMAPALSGWLVSGVLLATTAFVLAIGQRRHRGRPARFTDE